MPETTKGDELAKSVELGTFATLEQAEAAKDMAANMAGALGGKTLEASIRYTVVGLVGPKINGQHEITASGQFVCRTHEKAFGSAQALAAHKTMVHKKRGHK